MKKLILITGIALLCFCDTKVYANTFHHSNQMHYQQSRNFIHQEIIQHNQEHMNLHSCQFPNCNLFTTSIF